MPFVPAVSPPPDQHAVDTNDAAVWLVRPHWCLRTARSKGDSLSCPSVELLLALLIGILLCEVQPWPRPSDWSLAAPINMLSNML